MSNCIDAVLDEDSSGLESLDEELGIPSVRTPVYREHKVMQRLHSVIQ